MPQVILEHRLPGWTFIMTSTTPSQLLHKSRRFISFFHSWFFFLLLFNQSRFTFDEIWRGKLILKTFTAISAANRSVSTLNHIFFCSLSNFKNWLDWKTINSESTSQNHFYFPLNSVKTKLTLAFSLPPYYLSSYLLWWLLVFLPEQAGGVGDGRSDGQQGVGATGGQAILGRCGFHASQLLIPWAAAPRYLQNPNGYWWRDQNQQNQRQVQRKCWTILLLCWCPFVFLFLNILKT